LAELLPEAERHFSASPAPPVLTQNGFVPHIQVNRSGHMVERLVQLQLLRRAERRAERGQRGPKSQKNTQNTRASSDTKFNATISRWTSFFCAVFPFLAYYYFSHCA
jgi:hypothetical protein